MGDPSKSLFVEKLTIPSFCGGRKNIIKTKIILKNTLIKFNIIFVRKETSNLSLENKTYYIFNKVIVRIFFIF